MHFFRLHGRHRLRPLAFLAVALLLLSPAVIRANTPPAAAEARVIIDPRTGWTNTGLAYERHTNCSVLDETGDFPRFIVIHPEHRHIWLSRPFQLPLNVREDYPILVMRYRASGSFGNPNDHVLALHDHPQTYNVRVQQIQHRQLKVDGEVHEIRVDLRRAGGNRLRGPVIRLGLGITAGDQGPATFELRDLWFEAAPATQPSADVADPVPAEPITVQVVDLRGAPLAGARVSVPHERVGLGVAARTDDQGRATLTPWRNAEGAYRLLVTHAGFAGLEFTAVQAGQSLRAALEAAQPLGGTVVDEEGVPVAGAVIEFLETGRPAPENQRVLAPARVLTDAQGHWHQEGFRSALTHVEVAVWHPEFIRPRLPAHPVRHTSHHVPGELNARVVARSGWTITGRVTDAQGKPLAQAKVLLGEHRLNASAPLPSTQTDAEGRYRLGQLVEDTQLLTVTAPGHVPDQKQVHANPGTGAVEQDFSLSSSPGIRLRVLDSTGQPVRNAGVAVYEWRKMQGTLWKTRTDAEGRVHWDGAPNEPTLYSVHGRNLIAAGHLLLPSEEEQVITLLGFLRIRGQVTDAHSGQPIPAVHATHGSEIRERSEPHIAKPHWGAQSREPDQDGRYEFSLRTQSTRHYVRIEAPGYHPVISPVLVSSETVRDLVFDAQLVPRLSLEGIVLTPDGQPAAGATLFFAPPGKTLHLRTTAPHVVELSIYDQENHFPSDEQGRFQIPNAFTEQDLGLLCVLHPTGYAELRRPTRRRLERIALKPWATVSGSIQRGHQPDAYARVHSYHGWQTAPRHPSWFERQVRLLLGFPSPRPGRPVTVEWQFETIADEQGQFTLQLPPGHHQLSRRVITGTGARFSSHEVALNLHSGQILSDLRIGGEGRSVRADLHWPETLPPWQDYSASFFSTTAPSDRTAARHVAARSFHARVHSNNTLHGEDLPPGDYHLQVTFYAELFPDRGEPIATLDHTFIVAPLSNDAPEEPQHLGTLEPQKVTEGR